MLRAIRFSILIVPLWCVLGAGQTGSVIRLDGSTITPAEIETTVNRLINTAKVTGIGIAILNNRQLVYLKAFGARDVANNLLLTRSLRGRYQPQGVASPVWPFRATGLDFYAPKTDADVTFERDANGRVTGVVVNVKGLVLRARRID